MQRKQAVKLELASRRPLNFVALIQICFQHDTGREMEREIFDVSYEGQQFG